VLIKGSIMKLCEHKKKGYKFDKEKQSRPLKLKHPKTYKGYVLPDNKCYCKEI